MQAITADLNVSPPANLAQPVSNSKQLDPQPNDFQKTLQDTDDKPVHKSGKHVPDPGNDPPAAPVPVPLPLPVTAVATLATNLALGGPIVSSLTPLVNDPRTLANVDVAAAAAGAGAGELADPGDSFAPTAVATSPGATLDTQASNASLLESSSTAAANQKGASPTAAAAPVAAAANAVGANAAATGDAGSSAAAPTDADVTSQTLLASTVAAAAATVVAPAVLSAPFTQTFATPATGVAPTAAANVAALVAMDVAQPATAVTAASAAQVVIGAAELSAAEKHSHAPTADKVSTSVSIEGAAGFAQLISSSSSADAAPANLKVVAGVDTPGFAQGVGSQVQVMVDNNLNTAKLQVSPASLGPIEVRIAIQNGHAQVWMTSHSAVTRDALESSTPQLKEMLGSQGFSQVSVDISQRSFQERTPQPHSYDWQPLSGEEGTAPIQSVAASAARGGSGVVDAYA